MLANMYLTMLPVILGGITNMLFTKTPLYKRYNDPIDGRQCAKDGKRIFGDNKTWIGFISMVIFVSAFQVICGLLCHALQWETYNDFYIKHQNTVPYNFLVGAILGFVYMLCELPNSFIKRRIDIPAGKTVHGFRGALFFVIDQIDSLIGVMLVLMVYSGISVQKYFGYVLVGGVTHIALNLCLKLMKIRRNI